MNAVKDEINQNLTNSYRSINQQMFLAHSHFIKLHY